MAGGAGGGRCPAGTAPRGWGDGGAAAGRRRGAPQRPGAGAGDPPPSCQQPPRRPRGLTRNRRGTRRAWVSGIFHGGQPIRGEAKVSPFCSAGRRLAGLEKCRAQAGSQEAAAAAQLRPSGRRRGGGARGGGEAAPRGPRRPGDWARDGAGRAEGNKLRSRFRAGERWTSSGERQERQRGRKEGEKGRRGPGDSGAAASRSRRSRDGLTAVARADPQPQGTKKGEGGEGGESGALQRAGRRRGRARAGGGGGASASAAHPGTRAPRSAAAAAALWQALVGERCARGPRSPLSRPSHACRVGGRPGAGARTSVTSCGGALPVMWLEAGGEEGKAGRGRRKCEGSREGGSARGARVLAKGGVGPWIGSLAGEEEQRNSLSVSEPPGCRTKKKTGKIQVLREAVKGQTCWNQTQNIH
ncbi:spidroin-1-like [Papio anubis]|uniref:spidroin-1-like n=1 Tax=Papio anubis TaxID=9555 RepID=UPI0012AE066F|nr:spidroin-1-like [Papio anubis]